MEILIALLNAAILFIWAKALISENARPEKKPAKRRELNEKLRNKTSRRKTRTRSCPASSANETEAEDQAASPTNET